MIHYCLFQAANRSFAIDVSKVREISDTHPIMPVPGGPSFVLGLALYRGQAITIWDLKNCLGDKTPTTVPPRFDLIFDAEEPFGLQVEHIFDILPFAQTSAEPVPATISPVLRKICGGIMSWRGQALLMLEPEQLIKVMVG
jgi:chemotaxis signal transduction protein